MLFGCSKLPKINARFQDGAGKHDLVLVLASPWPACWFFIWGRRRLGAGETGGQRAELQKLPVPTATGADYRAVHRGCHCPCVQTTQKQSPALFRPGLSKLVAGTGFEPVTFGL